MEHIRAQVSDEVYEAMRVFVEEEGLRSISSLVEAFGRVIRDGELSAETKARIIADARRIGAERGSRRKDRGGH